MTDAPAPYCMTNDNIILLLLIFNLVGISYVLLMNGANIIERTKCIFYYENKSTPYNDRTHITKICNALMYAQTIFYLTVIAMCEMQEYTTAGIEREPLLFFGAYAVSFLMFLILKRGVYAITNSILDTKKQMQEWDNLYFFTIKLLGFALTPAAIVLIFIPTISLNIVNFYIILIAIAYVYTITSGLIKIIFTTKSNYLEIFLYLCALEFLPIAMVWKSLLQLSEFITIKI